MRRRYATLLALSVLSAPANARAAKAGAPPPAPGTLVVVPADVSLIGPDAVQRLLVTGPARDGRQHDSSRQAAYESSDATVAAVAADGLITPRGNGKAEVRIRLGDATAKVAVTVADFGVEPPISFPNQIVPIFTKAGCNAGGCHGKASGQNRSESTRLNSSHAITSRMPSSA